METCEDEANLTVVGPVLAVHLVHRSTNVLIALVRFGYGCCLAEYTVRRRASRLLPPGPLLASWPLPAWPAAVKAAACSASIEHARATSRLHSTWRRSCGPLGVRLSGQDWTDRQTAGSS